MKGTFLLLFFAVAALTALGIEKPDDLTFPDLKGKSLAKVDIRLPGELPGEVNLVIFGFERDHQQEINTWIPRLEELQSERQGFRFIEVPFLAGRYRLMRSWIDGGMRSGIPAQEARERTITVYGGRKDAMRKLGVSDLSRIYAFLVTPSGEVLWQAEGSWSAEKDRALRAAVNRVL